MNKRTFGFKGFKCDPKTGELFCQPVRSKRPVFYEEGKVKQIKGKLSVCSRGLHFCNYIGQTIKFYPLRADHFFAKVSTGGKVDIHDNGYNTPKIAAKSLKIDEILLTSDVLKRLSRKYTGGVKTVKNIRNSTRILLFETPEIYVKYLKKLKTKRTFSADVRYYENYISLVYNVY